MPPTVTEQTTPSAVTVPIPTVSTEVAVALARDWDRRQSRHRMQRAARIYGGSMTLGNKIKTYPDKGWAALILVGCAFVFTALGFAGALVAGSVLR